MLEAPLWTHVGRSGHLEIDRGSGGFQVQPLSHWPPERGEISKFPPIPCSDTRGGMDGQLDECMDQSMLYGFVPK